MSFSNKFLNILKNCQKHEYQDKYINMFKKCLNSTGDKYIDAIKLYTILMLNIRNICNKKTGDIPLDNNSIFNNVNSTYIFSKLYIYLWKHDKKFAEHIMYSIIDSDDIQYLDCYYEFERILDFAEESNFPYEEQYHMYQTFSCLMGRRLKKDWENYISGTSMNISYCALWFLRKDRNNIIIFNENIFYNDRDYSFANKSYLYHFMVNNTNLIYEMVKSARDKKINYKNFNDEWEWTILFDTPPVNWDDIICKLDNMPNNYTYISMVLKNVLGLLYNNIKTQEQQTNKLIEQDDKPKITKPVIFNTIDECYSLICFVNEYIKNTHKNNIFRILPKEIIIKIIIGSNDVHINNIINNFFYHK